MEKPGQCLYGVGTSCTVEGCILSAKFTVVLLVCCPSSFKPVYGELLLIAFALPCPRCMHWDSCDYIASALLIDPGSRGHCGPSECFPRFRICS
jgi:hypothetical protein